MNAQSDNARLAGLIAKAIDAEHAGVFTRTAVDPAELLSSPVRSHHAQSQRPISRWHRVYERAMVALPMAACLGIVIGIASLADRHGNIGGGSVSMIDQALIGTSGRADLAQPAVSGVTMTLVSSCVSGPGHPVVNGCVKADMDADGDVDLLDMSEYQSLASASQ